ncbi:hypothetical protein ACFVUR_12840 [Stenotrophomonas bentonitica]|uniref:hypothetical protein n=1 Tax=Stenotrophomonas TaxID=40323 RepID=UPI0011AF959A|nr:MULTISPECIES: hypothetical protein [Stenotrophomonas]MDX5515999.1 hypothetical protein [Stenotrophomonas sp. RG-453]
MIAMGVKGSVLLLLLLPLLVMAGLAGCAGYEIQPPISATGQQCMQTCDARRDQCTWQAEAVARSEGDSCAFSQQRLASRCSAYTSESDRHRCETANGGTSCITPTANTSPCRERWELCALDCGGTMVER